MADPTWLGGSAPPRTAYIYMKPRYRNLARLPWQIRYEQLGRLGTQWRKWTILATHRHCRIEFQGPVRIGPGFSLTIPSRGTLIVGAEVDFRRGFACEISQQGVVEIGARTAFTKDAFIQCTTSVRIGEDCQFAAGVHVVDGNHRFRDPQSSVLEQGYDYRPIVIGRDALILAKAVIVASVGERAVIGANSVVTRDVPAFCLAAGLPARVREYYGPPDRRPPGWDPA
jgi:acetyltransferase-like isoleucine patch superfamily enzyme